MFQATWLSRLHEAQESYKDACRRSESKRPSRADCSAAAIDITVQCENGSFLESPVEDQLRGGGGANPSSVEFNACRPAPSSLLGVPRGTYLDAYHQHHGHLGLREDPEDGSPDEGSRNRKIRSCSSDAAAALQRSEEEATTDEGGAGFIRRTSDPLCLHRLMPDTAAAETEKQPEVEQPCVVQIPVPTQRHQMLGRTTSYTDSTTTGRPSYSTRQPPGYYYSTQSSTHTPMSVYMASATGGGPLHSTPASLSALYTSSLYSGPDCHDAFMNRDTRMSFCRRNRRLDDEATTTPMITTTTNSAITHPNHRPQSLLVSHNSRETMTSAPPPLGVAMATTGTKHSSRQRRATSLRIHRRTQKGAPPPSEDSVYI